MQKKPTTRLGRSCVHAVDRSKNTSRTHKQHRTKNSLRDVILGGQDGLVIMLGIALAVVAAGGSNHVLVVTGIAAVGAFHQIVNKSSSVGEITLGTNTNSRWNLEEKLTPMGKSFGIVGLRTNIS